MKKSLTILILSCGIFSLSFSSFAKETSVKSYYPAPNGKYTKIQLKSTANATSPTCASPGVPAGTIYTDPKTGLISICKSDGTTSSPMGACFNQYGESGTTPSCPANYVQNGTAENYSLAGKDLVSWVCCLSSQGSNASPSPVKSGCFSTYSSSGQPALCSDIDKSAYDMGCETIKSDTDFKGITYKRNCCFNNTSGAIANGGYSACTPSGTIGTGSCSTDADCNTGDPCKKYTCHNAGLSNSYCSFAINDPVICNLSPPVGYLPGQLYPDSCGFSKCPPVQCPSGEILNSTLTGCQSPTDSSTPNPCSKPCYDSGVHPCGVSYTNTCGPSDSSYPCTGTGPVIPGNISTVKASTSCNAPISDTCSPPNIIGYGSHSCPLANCDGEGCTNPNYTCSPACSEGMICQSGTCVAPACTPACTNGTTCQAGTCLCSDSQPLGTSSDCGTCGNACTEDTACQSGTCAACPLATPNSCGGACVNVQTDSNNCGTCGNACAGGTACQSGTCAACPIATPNNCYGECVNFQTDSYNCGSCTLYCLQGTTCQSGACVCPNDGKLLGTANDCGSCGNTCPAGQVCHGDDGCVTPINGQCGTAVEMVASSIDSGWGPDRTFCAPGQTAVPYDPVPFPAIGQTVTWHCLGLNGGVQSPLCVSYRQEGEHSVDKVTSDLIP